MKELTLFICTLLLSAGIWSACRKPAEPERPASATLYPTLGALERLDPRLDSLIAPEARIEKLAEGFEWSEGPVWVPDGNYLLFSDIPQNAIFKWKEGEGISIYMKPSGYSGEVTRGGEPGSNGLALDEQGRLVLCEHGDRRISREQSPGGEKTTLVDNYQGKRLNSPNDLCFRSNGDLYFTDPPYGLPKGVEDPSRKLDFQGVYRLTPSGELQLLTDELSRPNGIGFSPDEKTLYVANSDPERAIWMRYDVTEDGRIENGRVLFDATSWVGQRAGLPDGLKVAAGGNLFATGPGGVLILTAEGEHLGTILTGEATANCAWGGDGSVLYITADSYLLRIQTATRGAGW